MRQKRPKGCGSGTPFRHPTVGAHGVDLVGRDVNEGNERGNDQRGGDQEHRLLRPEISDRTHACGRETISDRGEAGIAAESLPAGGMTDEPEADRGDNRAHQAAGRGVQDLRTQNGRKDRPERDHQRARADRDHRKRGEAPFVPNGIDDGPAGHLECQGGEASGGENQADVDLRPLARREIDGEERAESRLHVGNAERKPV